MYKNNKFDIFVIKIREKIYLEELFFKIGDIFDKTCEERYFEQRRSLAPLPASFVFAIM